MAWHVGHSWETLLTIPRPILPGGPFPHVFPAAVVHLGESSAFLSFGVGGGTSVNYWKPSCGRWNKQTTLGDCVLVLLSFPWVCPECSFPLEIQADPHHWSLQNTTLKIILPFLLSCPWHHGCRRSLKALERCWATWREDSVASKDQAEVLHFFFKLFYFYLKSKLGYCQREFCALLKELKSGRGSWYLLCNFWRKLVGGM